MSARKLILALSLLGIAAVAALLVRSMLATPPSETVTTAEAKPAVEMPRILVVAADLPVGSFVSAGGLRWQEWPEGAVLQTHFLEGRDAMEDLEGAVIRTRVSPGEPLVRGHIVRPGETATAIARKHGLGLNRLRRLNPSLDLDLLRIGVKVRFK